jgi:multidrug efflux pump subunit AcrA (membrane-fusion protein)
MSRFRPSIAIAVLLTGALALAGCGGGKSASTPGAAGSTQTVFVKLLIQQVPIGVGASLKTGQPVKVKSTGVLVGNIDSVEVTASAQAEPSSTGRLVESQSPVTDDLLITIKGQAIVSDTGFRFGASNLYVNSQDEYLTPTTIVKGTLVSIEPGK